MRPIKRRAEYGLYGLNYARYINNNIVMHSILHWFLIIKIIYYLRLYDYKPIENANDIYVVYPFCVSDFFYFR